MIVKISNHQDSLKNVASRLYEGECNNGSSTALQNKLSFSKRAFRAIYGFLGSHTACTA